MYSKEDMLALCRSSLWVTWCHQQMPSMFIYLDPH